MARGVHMRLEGAKELDHLFREMPGRIKKRVLRRGIGKATTVITREAKKRAPTRTKTTKKSLTRKVKTYAASGNVVGVVGSDRSVEATIASQTGGQPKRHIPANILHLIEKGHGGPHPAPAHPFLEPAAQASQGPASKVAIDTMKQAIDSELAKLAKKGGR